jgi:hypothetical protein
MSKPISISFGKTKIKSFTSTPHQPSGASTPVPLRKTTAFTADPEDDAEADVIPAHESVVGFASDGGAILSRPVKTQEEKVIENKGNADWRTRGRPAKGTSQDPGGAGVAPRTTVERDETSKNAGLQFAEKKTPLTSRTTNGQYSQHSQTDLTQHSDTSPDQTS